MPKVGKAELLRLELAEAEAAEKFVAAKAKRESCGECGRVKPNQKVEAQIGKAREKLTAARRAFREARSGS